VLGLVPRVRWLLQITALVGFADQVRIFVRFASEMLTRMGMCNTLVLVFFLLCVFAFSTTWRSCNQKISHTRFLVQSLGKKICKTFQKFGMQGEWMKISFILSLSLSLSLSRSLYLALQHN
jgi:hypothetical protein